MVDFVNDFVANIPRSNLGMTTLMIYFATIKTPGTINQEREYQMLKKKENRRTRST